MAAQPTAAGADVAACCVLALNSGSSSLKFGLLRVREHGIDAMLAGEVEPASLPADAALVQIAERLAQAGVPAPRAIGHRIVHGGPALRDHAVIDDAVLRQLDAAVPFAPLHLPAALALIRASARRHPGLPQVACLDTSFHARMPPAARTLPLPRAWRDRGLRRYGFHGLSCESIVRQLGPRLPSRLVIAHLGHGASITAVRDGVSVDTSMGLTPGGGVMMGTRSGDLDPGVLLHLMRRLGLDAEAIEQGLESQSGLLGVSGLSDDMRVLHQAAGADVDARLAIEMFAQAVAKSVAGMATVLGGMEMLVFTGGIGEHDPIVRDAIVERLAWLGLRLLPEGEGCAVRVMPSQEDAQIARHTAALCAGIG